MRTHRVEDILLGFEPKDAGSIPAGSVFYDFAILMFFDVLKVLVCFLVFLTIKFVIFGDILTKESIIWVYETLLIILADSFSVTMIK